MFDGMVAIETGKASPTGALYNEVPDRVSDAAMFIGAGYGLGGQPPLGYLAACLAVFLAYLRRRAKWPALHKEFCGPMAKAAASVRYDFAVVLLRRGTRYVAG